MSNIQILPDSDKVGLIFMTVTYLDTVKSPYIL